MTLLAFVLVITAAFLHATWNLLAKRAGGGAAFTWLFGLISSLIYAPAAFYIMWSRGAWPTAGQFLFIAGSAVLHTGYFLLLQKGYRTGDLSLVYPLARGTGPLLSSAVAIAFLGERPGPLAVAGALAIAAGIFFLAGGAEGFGTGRTERGRTGPASPAVLYGLLTGLFIASYTVWDKVGVTQALIPPLVLDWGANLGRVLLLTPTAWRRRKEVHGVWREKRHEVLGVAVLTPLAYILVLTALTFTPVSYVAPARETSILIGAILGTRLLQEGDPWQRIGAAGLIMLGIAGLAVG